MGDQRTTDALARIDRRETEVNESGHGTEDHWRWALDVLNGDREILESHVPTIYEGGIATVPFMRPPRRIACWDGRTWPCPDAARVLNRYAQEVDG